MAIAQWTSQQDVPGGESNPLYARTSSRTLRGLCEAAAAENTSIQPGEISPDPAAAAGAENAALVAAVVENSPPLAVRIENSPVLTVAEASVATIQTLPETPSEAPRGSNSVVSYSNETNSSDSAYGQFIVHEVPSSSSLSRTERESDLNTPQSDDECYADNDGLLDLRKITL